jgi:4a-hydroxytetrahydrobiopterin dehydratase
MVLSIEAVPAAEMDSLLARLPGWKVEGNALVRTESFPKYLDALEFIYRVGHAAEEANHHPDMIMNYRTVTVKYWTHKIGGISRGDIAMAGKVSEIFRQFLPSA